MNDGGPAFPRSGNINVASQEGMSLRDYFAAMSMGQIMGSNAPSSFARDNPQLEVDAIIRALASQSYEIADQMLKEREKINDNKTNA